MNIKYLRILLGLCFQECIANPIPENYRLQHKSWGEGVHNGHYDAAIEGAKVVSYLKKMMLFTC